MPERLDVEELGQGTAEVRQDVVAFERLGLGQGDSG